MIKRKYPKIVVAVCEDRTEGIKKMISVESFDLLLLDDAFQHRKVNPHIQILLSAFDRPYFTDLPLPSGRLREFRSGVRRADALVFTKVPPHTGESQRSKYKSKVDVALRNSTFFAEYKMPEPLLVNGIDPLGRIILVTGIAYSKLLLAHLQKSREVLHFKFKDHYTYTDADMRKINESVNDETLVVTTAKDWVKWNDFEEIWKKWNLAVADQEVSFYQEKDFDAFLDKQFAKYGKSQT